MIAVPAFAGDPPDRVMRLKYMSGQVSFQPGGVDDWVAATLNRPLTTADRVWTDKDSRAELKLATAALRMDSETSLTISNLSDNTVQVELDQGVLNVHVRRLVGGEIYEVDTPNVAFTLLKPGDYRFEVDSRGDATTVIVRHGKGEGNGNGRGVQIESGEMARFEHGNTLMHTTAQAPRPDGFDDWCRVRDDREDKAESVRYVSDDVVGYEDLDEYGYWRPVPTYGYVWYPRTAVVGWAPYRYGHWVWIDPWGWTWVDDAPWGFAPFHYGRWVYSSYGWGWCPGPRHIHPIYAPALVAWFGGSHWGVGLSFGGPAVGWVPLGWGEPYYPYYRVSPGYVRNVNISNTHITNITYVTNNYNTFINNGGNQINNIRYVNQEHGITAVSTGVLQHGRPVARESVALSGRDMGDGHFMHTADVAPARGAVLGGRQNVPTAIPPQGAVNRSVVSKMAPPERPARFETREPFIERNRGMAVDPDTMSKLRRTAPENSAARGQGTGISVTPAEAARPANSEMNRPPVNIARPNAPDTNRPANAAGERPANAAGERPANAVGERPENAMGRQVPRPPERSPRVINLEGSPENAGKENAPSPARSMGDNGNSAGGTQHYVPRPPSDRRPAGAAEGTPRQDTNVNRAPASEMRKVPQPSEGYKAAPENRTSPVFDRKDSNQPGRSAVETEAAGPRNVPRPQEGNAVRNENRAPANVERRSAPENRPANVERQQERQQQREERRSAPPASDKPAKSESAPKNMSRYVPSPHNDSYSPRASSFSPRESSYSPAPRASYVSARTPSYSPRYESYSPRYERPSASYSRPSYSQGAAYSRSSARAPAGARASYSHAASSAGAARASSRAAGSGSHASRGR